MEWAARALRQIAGGEARARARATNCKATNIIVTVIGKAVRRKIGFGRQASVASQQLLPSEARPSYLTIPLSRTNP
jgi:hypothetical protein